MADKTARDIADAISLDWDADLFPRLRAILGSISSESGSDLLTTLGFAPDASIFAETAASTLDEAAARAADLVGKRILDDGTIVDSPRPGIAITESTRDMMFDTINEALEAGLSAGALRDRIVQDFAFSPSRALGIARTERSWAQNRGALSAAINSGVVKGKKWVIASEHDKDDECDENQDDGVIAVDEAFTSGDDAPPAHTNCSCTIEFSTEDVPDEEGDDGE